MYSSCLWELGLDSNQVLLSLFPFGKTFKIDIYNSIFSNVDSCGFKIEKQIGLLSLSSIF
jgi:hypothetical protein